MKGMRKPSCPLLSVCMALIPLPATAFAAPADGAEAEYSLNGGATWTDAELLNAVFSCYTTDNSIIRLKRDIVLSEVDGYYAIVIGYDNRTMKGIGITAIITDVP